MTSSARIEVKYQKRSLITSFVLQLCELIEFGETTLLARTSCYNNEVSDELVRNLFTRFKIFGRVRFRSSQFVMLSNLRS